MVVAGAGARGAYEAGALSVLLPALEAAGQRPTVFVGTSAGAINAAGFASLINYGAAEASRRVLDLWRSIDAGCVYRPVPLGATVALTSSIADVLRGRPRPPIGLLDTAPLWSTLDRLIPWGQIHENLRHGELLEAVAVSATTEADHRTRMFVAQSPASTLPSPDPDRGIDYRDVQLGSRHVIASSAMPVVFPAVLVDDHQDGPTWYRDGGLRLNTPIKPALVLGANRVVIVATSPKDLDLPPPVGHPVAPAPGVSGGLSQVMHAVLADRMIEDLQTLRIRNQQATGPVHQPPASTAVGSPVAESERIPYLFAGPETSGTLGDLAAEVIAGGRGRHRGLLAWVRALPRTLFAREHERCEVLSYLLFDPDFIAGAIELGERDARRALDSTGSVVWCDP